MFTDAQADSTRDAATASPAKLSLLIIEFLLCF
jgi:hypothetical protein